jgi:hypothetical protein
MARFYRCKFEARGPEDRRFDDIEKLYDIEINTAIEISLYLLASVELNLMTWLRLH